MAKRKEFSAFCSILHGGYIDSYIRPQLEGDALVLVREVGVPWWETYIPNAGNLDAAIEVAKNLNEEQERIHANDD